MRRALGRTETVFFHKKFSGNEFPSHLKAALQKVVADADALRFSHSYQVGNIKYHQDNLTYQDLIGITENHLMAPGSELSGHNHPFRLKNLPFFTITGERDSIAIIVDTDSSTANQTLLNAFFTQFDLRSAPATKEKTNAKPDKLSPKKQRPSINAALINLITLRNLINDHFNIQEISQLCFDLGVDFENLGESNTRKAKAQALIEYMKRKSRLGELLALVIKQRPNAEDWAKIIK
jgi:hypothetical protein